MTARNLKNVGKGIALILLGMLISMSLPTISATEAPAPTLGSAPDLQIDPPPVGPAAQTWVSCTPVNVASITTRIHVKCAASVGGIWYWAVATDSPAHAARMLSVLNSAQIAGRTLSLLYDPADTSNLPPGCQVSDCRRLLGVIVY